MLLARQLDEEDARLRVERASECLASFTQALGHDVRAPFISIDSMMQLLDLDAPRLSETELRARIALATRAARRTCAYGLGMVGELFELMRANSGKWPFEPAATDLLATVSEVREIMNPQAHAKGLDIVTRLVGCAPCDVATIWTDANRLRQALVNVVGNAVKFSESGAIEIDLRVPRLGAETGGFVEVCVRDTGPGLEPGSIALLFEPFHQSSRTAARAGEGLGLGLAIAQRCANLIGGAWTAENRTDARGASFTLRIPREAPTPTPAQQPPRADAASTKAPANGLGCGPLRVLIVDDAIDASRLAAHHLGALGHEATIVTTVAAAKERLGAAGFDLVISDIELPDGSSRDVLRVAGKVPVLCSSARPDVSPEYRLAAGALPKPITRESLKAAIERVLRR